MSEQEELRRTLEALLATQAEHVMYAKVAVDWGRPHSVSDGVWVRLGSLAPELWPVARVVQVVRERERKIEEEPQDRFNSGLWFPAWHEILWEICALRVANPGVPIEFLLGGANGSGKSQFAAAVMMRAMVKAPRGKRLFWAYTIDEPNSETVQQAALYDWLPNSYKTEGGGVKTTARTKLKFNDSGGFTDNRFSLDNGSRMECRFWSKDIRTLEGPRPWCVWSDEEEPLPWVEGIRRRLLTFAEGTKRHIGEWSRLLSEHRAGRMPRFPLDRLCDLVQGLHLITYTAKSGYTETVAAFVEGGKVMRTEKATLLARTDPKTGEACGFEEVPRLIHDPGGDTQRRMMFLYAWENPYGGNWEGMQKEALKKSRAEILWWCYGVAEKIGDSPFPNFNVQAHVRPLLCMPRVGTWWHVVDPVASGGRAWFQLWAIVSGETRGFIQPGDIFVAWEWPKEDWHVREVGFMGKWAEPGGKAGLGVRGPAQGALGWGYRRQKEEISAVEAKLHAVQFGPNGRAAGPQGRSSETLASGALFTEPRIVVRDGNRIMDSRAANTEKENESESKTLIDWMLDDTSAELRDGLLFVPAGRDSGAATGQTRVHPGEQMINNLLYFDKELAVLDEATGWLSVPPALGKGPRLYISEGCTNLIAALRHYPGIFTGADSAFKDPIDCLRYLVIADPVHRVPYEAEEWEGKGW